MANLTPHYKLKLPETSEYFNISDFNGNSEIIDNALFELKKKISSFIISAVSGLHPEYEQEFLTVHVSESATLIGQHYYDISTDIFDYKRDGLLILRDAFFLIEKPLYYFEEQTNAVRVNFTVPSFSGTETLYFYIYRKPYDTPSTIGTAIKLIDGNDTGVNTGAAIPEIHW